MKGNIKMKKILIAVMTLTLCLSLASPAFAATETAKPTTSTVLVNGRQVAFDAYNIGGNNYFKLRDLAYSLSGTEKRFEVGYNAAANAITLTAGTAYTPVGGEMASKGAGNKSATPTSSKITLNGNATAFTAYNIGGNNYFKLRDIGEAFNFGVDWDGAKQTIAINTSKGYTPETATVATTGAQPAAYEPRDIGYGKIGSFSTKDIYGKSVDNSLFSGKPLTFINYWASWCPPCINELPDMQGLVDKYGDKVNFASIVIDYSDDPDYITQLCEEYLHSYTNVQDLAGNLSDAFDSGYVPTSLIVDSEGNILCEQIVGGYGSEYSGFIDDALKLVGEAQ
jgi:thiol-disulfide isomerase/thioredoxin